MLTESTKHSTRIDEFGSIFWVAVTVIERDGKEVARQTNSTTLYPGIPLLDVPDEVSALARARWNPQTVDDFTEQEIAKHVEERAKIETAIAEVDAKKLELENKKLEVEKLAEEVVSIAETTA